MRRIVLSMGALVACLLVASLAAAQATQTPQTLVVTVDRASMREKPTVDARLMARLPRGEELEVLDTIGEWYHVRVKSSRRTGYVSNTVVRAGAASPPGAPARPGAPAAANQPAGRPLAAAAKAHPGIQVFGIVDAETMSASKSFEAVLSSGKASITNLGFGVEGTDLWKGLFARVAYTHSSNAGTRVFVDSSLKAHSLNVPLTIEITPIEIGAGWRSALPSTAKAGVRAYAGAGLLLQRYKETSSFASAAEDTDTTDKGAVVFGGLEVDVKFVRIGLEGQFRSVPNVLGVGGASLAYDEKNLGGGVFRLTFGVGF